MLQLTFEGVTLMKKKEIIFVIIILAIAAAIWGYQYFTRPESYKSVTITVRGKEYGTYSLDEDQVIKINNTNVAEIKNGQIAMTEAKCPDQLCIHQGPFGKRGGLIVCLPNEVIIEGENIAKDGGPVTDAVSQ